MQISSALETGDLKGALSGLEIDMEIVSRVLKVQIPFFFPTSWLAFICQKSKALEGQNHPYEVQNLIPPLSTPKFSRCLLNIPLQWSLAYAFCLTSPGFWSLFTIHNRIPFVRESSCVFEFLMSAVEQILENIYNEGIKLLGNYHLWPYTPSHNLVPNKCMINLTIFKTEVSSSTPQTEQPNPSNTSSTARPLARPRIPTRHLD